MTDVENTHKNVQGITIWITGLSGSGKTTISMNLQKKLQEEGFFSILLDGDCVRSGLNKDLGFSLCDREENIRRVAELAKILNMNGIVVICAFISPTNKIRKLAKSIIGSSRFFQVFSDTPYKLCKQRDSKGLYEKALKGDIKNFTGITSKFEHPDDADLIVKTESGTSELIADYIYQHINLFLNELVDINIIRNTNIAIRSAISSGLRVLEIYNANGFDVEYKNDQSPLTNADKASHEIIINLLRKSNIPILSEEGKNIDFSIRKKWDMFWLVDPIDGTKEFINKSGDFTINIALIHNNLPIVGVVYTPVLSELYIGAKDFGAYKIKTVDPSISFNDVRNKGQKLPLNIKRDDFCIVGSRSFMNEETKAYIEDLKINHPNAKFHTRGSSLKICMVAEGVADIYPRLGKTMEWDTAAGHAIMKAVGKNIYTLNDDDLTYNKVNLVNPNFIAK